MSLNATTRPLEQILGLLIDAGFAPAHALNIYRVYYGFLYRHILNELKEYIEEPDENELRSAPTAAAPARRGVSAVAHRAA